MNPSNASDVSVIDNDAYIETLPGAELVLRFLGNVLSDEPQLKTIKLLRDSDFLASIPFASSNLEVQKGIAYLIEWQVAASATEDDDLLLAVREECFRIFFVPRKAVAPPWQSYYTDSESLLFANETFQVRRWYRKYGLQIEKLNNEPDDHIGIMLSFLAFLAREEMSALERDDAVSVAKLQSDQLLFVASHLLGFLPEWAERITTRSGSLLYASLASVALGVVNERYGHLANSPWLKERGFSER